MAIGTCLAISNAGAAETTLYGVVTLNAGSVQRSDAQARTLTMNQGSMQTSFVGIRGEQQLDNGWAGIFELESFLQPDVGAAGRNGTDPFWSRNAWAGFRTPHAGQVTFGRTTNPFYTTQIALNPFAGSTVFSPLVLHSFVPNYGMTILGDTVWNKAITYTTPNLNGLTGNGIYSFGGKAGDNSFNNIGMNALYATPQSPWTFAGAAQRVREVVAVGSTQQTAYLGGAAYDFKVVKLYGSAQRAHENNIDVNTKTYQLGAGIPVTRKGTIMASVAETKLDTPVAVNNLNRNTAGLGYDYYLSKTTDVQAVYLHDKITGKPSGSSYLLGIRQAF